MKKVLSKEEKNGLLFTDYYYKIMKKVLSKEEKNGLLEILKVRFEKHMERHKGIKWTDVEVKLKDQPTKLWSLNEMEITGGEPDVVAFDKNSGEYSFYDCSAETPKERRNYCYDRAALDARKEHKPANSAIEVAKEMGVDILTEQQYRYLQTLGKFDTKTSSWVLTPPEIRRHGGATFCDSRYDHVFFYHNGAQSYYAARGFRGCLKI